MKKTFLTLLCLVSMHAWAQSKTAIKVSVNDGSEIIPKEIYGQFAEHLGTCIYGGLWVGEDSAIPNTNGYRNDVLEALKALQIPVLRWPGGCFADNYHWRDGIGPRDQRPSLINNTWGGTVEDNSFGTHEFLNLCELLGCEAYVSGNVGSGTVEEMSSWVDYMTAPQGSPMAKLRKENGREEPWHVKYLGIGNEAWGCGGNMRPEYYSDLFRRYVTYCHNYPNNRLYKIASGASDYNYDWTETLMKGIGRRMDAISVHYYTVKGWDGSKGSATRFSNEEYYWAMGKCLEIEQVLKKHIAIMDKYDPKNHIALLVDEWGTWWDEEPGTVPGHLYQQNSLRDAMVAALSLDVFHRYTRRIKMCNIAQMVNVLQAMILTRDNQMVLTPTYHVFEMYKVHQDATYLPMDIKCEKRVVDGDRIVPMVSATASRNKEGVINLTLTNVDLDNAQEINIELDGYKPGKVTGRVLSADNVNDFNDFDHPNTITPQPFKDAKVKNGIITLKIPAKSIVQVVVTK